MHVKVNYSIIVLSLIAIGINASDDTLLSLSDLLNLKGSGDSSSSSDPALKPAKCKDLPGYCSNGGVCKDTSNNGVSCQCTSEYKGLQCKVRVKQGAATLTERTVQQQPITTKSTKSTTSTTSTTTTTTTTTTVPTTRKTSETPVIPANNIAQSTATEGTTKSTTTPGTSTTKPPTTSNPSTSSTQQEDD